MQNLLTKKGFICDMDGVIYHGNRLLPGVQEFVAWLQKEHKEFLFLTNNSGKTQRELQSKLSRMGLRAAPEDFLTSVNATVLYLRQKYHRKIYAFGTASFRQQLRQGGLPVTDVLAEDIDCLCMGFDTELTFQKLEDACILLNRGVEYVATNPDWVCPTWYGSVPDCGSVAEMLYRATGRRPRFIGKSEPDMVELAIKETNFTKVQTILLGDRLYTDIKSGVRAGVDTVLVLSGEATLKDLAASDVKPTYVMKDIREFLNNLTE